MGLSYIKVDQSGLEKLFIGLIWDTQTDCRMSKLSAALLIVLELLLRKRSYVIILMIQQDHFQTW